MKIQHTFLVLLFLLPYGLFAQEEDGNPDFRFTGFLQQHFSNGTNPDDPWAFSIRRMRAGVQGQVHENVSFVVMAGAVEPPDGTPQMINAFVDVRINPFLSVRAGQFFVPFGIEGQESITRNPAIDRSLVVRRLNTHRMFRDIGVQLNGSHGILGYQLALINGAGANAAGRIDPKDIAGRISVAPFHNLEIGFSGQFGNYVPETMPDTHAGRNRYGIDINLGRPGLQLRSEIIYRRDELPLDQEQNYLGGYILGDVKVLTDVSLTGRFEYLESERESSITTMGSYMLGMNYMVYEYVRLSANYEMRYDGFTTNGREHLLLVQLQLAI